jgi:hypothetical protein
MEFGPLTAKFFGNLLHQVIPGDVFKGQAELASVLTGKRDVDPAEAFTGVMLVLIIDSNGPCQGSGVDPRWRVLGADESVKGHGISLS